MVFLVGKIIPFGWKYFVFGRNHRGEISFIFLPKENKLTQLCMGLLIEQILVILLEAFEEMKHVVSSHKSDRGNLCKQSQ